MRERKQNTLSAQEFFQLCCYMQQNRDRLIKERPNDARLCLEAAAALKFPVSETNCRTAKKTVGVEYHAKPERSDRLRPGPGTRTRLVCFHLMKHIRLTSQIAQALISLSKALGEDHRVSTEVRSLACECDKHLEPLEELYDQLSGRNREPKPKKE